MYFGLCLPQLYTPSGNQTWRWVQTWFSLSMDVWNFHCQVSLTEENGFATFCPHIVEPRDLRSETSGVSSKSLVKSTVKWINHLLLANHRCNRCNRWITIWKNAAVTESASSAQLFGRKMVKTWPGPWDQDATGHKVTMRKVILGEEIMRFFESQHLEPLNSFEGWSFHQLRIDFLGCPPFLDKTTAGTSCFWPP